jgi:hypothetical protein
MKITEQDIITLLQTASKGQDLSTLDKKQTLEFFRELLLKLANFANEIIEVKEKQIDNLKMNVDILNNGIRHARRDTKVEITQRFSDHFQDSLKCEFTHEQKELIFEIINNEEYI